MRNPISTSPQPSANNTKSETNENKKPTKTACCAKIGVKRGPWTPEEDEMLCEYIKKEGSTVGRWRTLPKRAGLARCGKSCRLRWMNYLRPSVKRGHIQSDEEDLILRLHRLLGNRWSLIAGRIPGRTDNEIKNYWNTHLSKKLISQGIDPRTHKPLESNNIPPSNDKPSSSTPNYSQNPNPRFTSPPPSNDHISPGQFTETHRYYHEGTNIDHYQGLDLQGSDGIRNEENDEEDNINYCSDDVFSSFLDSLINEDAFRNNQNQILQQPQLVSGDSIVPQEGFAFGAGWDAPIMSVFNQTHDSKMFSDDQVEKK